jgi:hypothetical protein
MVATGPSVSTRMFSNSMARSFARWGQYTAGGGGRHGLRAAGGSAGSAVTSTVS